MAADTVKGPPEFRVRIETPSSISVQEGQGNHDQMSVHALSPHAPSAVL
jgi:hypothetical protein